MHTIPLTRALIPACVSTATAASHRDDLFMWLYPDDATRAEGLGRWEMSRMRKLLLTPLVVVRVCVSDDSDDFWDGTERVLGFASWERRLGSAEGKGSKHEVDEEVWGRESWLKYLERVLVAYERRYELAVGIGATHSPEHLAEFYAAWEKPDPRVDELVDLGRGNGQVWLGLLAVRPEFQRRGVGSRLMRWGLERADEEGVPCSLCASPAGRALYDKNGFRVVSTIKYGGIEDPIMLRYPGGGDRPATARPV